MALVQREPERVCDIFGGKRDVREIHVKVTEGENSVLFGAIVDMSPRALKRALQLIGKAVTKPGHGNRNVVEG